MKGEKNQPTNVKTFRCRRRTTDERIFRLPKYYNKNFLEENRFTGLDCTPWPTQVIN